MQELELLKKVIREAGEAVMSFYGSAEVTEKKDESPVTQADLASEKFLFEGLKGFGYAFLSEEGVDDLKRLEAERVWIIDPLDGTKDFIQQTGEFSIMVGLVENGRPIVGAVYQPAEKKLYYAVKGEGAFLELEDGSKREMQLSDLNDFSEARMLVSRNHLLELEQKVAEKLGITKKIPCGSAGLKSSLIAAGQADLYMNTSDRTFEWDICAADIIVKEAGGVLTDLKGREIIYNKENPRNVDGFVVGSLVLTKNILNSVLLQELQ